MSKFKMMNTIKHIILIISLLTATICYGQDKLLTTKKIINEIAKNNYVAPYPDNFINYETPQYKLYIQPRLRIRKFYWEIDVVIPQTVEPMPSFFMEGYI